MSLRRVRRTPDGVADPNDPLVAAFNEQIERAATLMSEDLRLATLAEILHSADDAGYYEVWLLLAFPTWIPNGTFAACHHKFWNWLEKIEPDKRPLAFVACWARGMGKALDVSTLLPTPDGWVSMGDVSPGDVVLDHASEPTRVLFKSTVESRPAFRVIFDDGVSVVADGNHDWTVVKVGSHNTFLGDFGPEWWGSSPQSGDVSAPMTLTTEDLLDRLSEGWAIPHATTTGLHVPARRITSIRGVGMSDVACIGVDTPSHLYLAGEGRVPTHNTSSVQLAITRMACKQTRGYGIYVGAAQSAVEDKVSAVGEMLMSPLVRTAYPDVSEIYETSTGAKRDWRKARIRTASGFTLDALGMDQAVRGVKLDEERPGFLALDDLESKHDSAYVTAKKMDTVASGIVPALAQNGVAFYIQNWIHPDSIMAQVVDRRAEMLSSRVLSGPVPQVYDLEYDERIPGGEDDPDQRVYVVTGGTPSWPGADLKTSEQQMNDEGLTAFMSERQHEERIPEGGAFPSKRWLSVDEGDLPESFTYICRSWDLAASESGSADFTAGVLMALLPGSLKPVILDVVRIQAEVGDVEALVMEYSKADAEIWPHYHALLEAQPAAAGKAWNRDWIRLMTAAGVKHEMIPPQGSKAFRSDKFAVCQQGSGACLLSDDVGSRFVRMRGSVARRLKVPTRWRKPFKLELAQFLTDFQRNDDQVDGATQGYNWLIKRSRGGAVRNRRSEAGSTSRSVGGSGQLKRGV